MGPKTNLIKRRCAISETTWLITENTIMIILWNPWPVTKSHIYFPNLLNPLYPRSMWKIRYLLLIRKMILPTIIVPPSKMRRSAQDAFHPNPFLTSFPTTRRHLRSQHDTRRIDLRVLSSIYLISFYKNLNVPKTFVILQTTL